ncbi:hypothetical protein [Bradyrhizobium acaciae]|uniref:hypothetical protein n=1 Tax=Bradyrhizobium acaciae TaxID=2683706 RepID=UPI001E305C7D|nr:hypothetical protein [Bradyrhizobium acaciae]MCC8977458.1 hypothetical protein [Bradyrhizobium acaciae]
MNQRAAASRIRIGSTTKPRAPESTARFSILDIDDTCRPAVVVGRNCSESLKIAIIAKRAVRWRHCRCDRPSRWGDATLDGERAATAEREPQDFEPPAEPQGYGIDDQAFPHEIAGQAAYSGQFPGKS